MDPFQIWSGIGCTLFCQNGTETDIGVLSKIRTGSDRFGTVRNGTERYGMVKNGMERYYKKLILPANKTMVCDSISRLSYRKSIYALRHQ